MDMIMGYHQIQLREEDKGNTALGASMGLQRSSVWDKNSPGNFPKDDEHNT